MEKNIIKFFQCLCFVAITVSCQNIETLTDNAEESSLSSDNGQLDLSLSTLEQQTIEKNEAKKVLLEARQKRTVIEPNNIEELSQNSSVNIALYAIQTFNEVGERIFNRIPTKKNKTNSCRRFLSPDDAQRFFLENNGPKNDFWDLDPDGDGFACAWSPESYRKLLTN